MMKPPNKSMMIMLLPEHVMGALKGADEQSGEGEPAEQEESGEEMGEGNMGKRRCPMCGRC